MFLFSSLQLDAKKSPLALLAQTCSSIGKDTSPNKNIIPPLDGKNKDGGKSSPSQHKPGSADDRKSQSSSEKKDSGSPRSDSKSSFRAPAPKDIPPLVPISSSSSGSVSCSKSPHTASSESSSSSSSTSVSKSSESIIASSSPLSSSSVCVPTPSAGLHSNSRISLSCGNMLLEVNHHESAAASGLKHAAGLHPLMGKHETGYPGHPSGLIPPYYPHMLPHLAGHPLHMDAQAASSAYANGLAAHGLGLSSSHKALAGHGAPGSTSPYVAYARVKTASGGSTLVPICRDPYCTNCQIAMNNAQLTPQCGAGCTQCTHEKSAMPVPGAGGLSAGGLSSSLSLPMYPMAGISSLAPTLPSFYPHSMLPGGHHGLPYVCNWMAGSEYCGKRFNTSEELLQHLRTHTSSSDAPSINPLAATLPTYSLAGTLPTPGLPGCHSHYAPTPGSLSPNSALRGYPRTMSPSSALRYHPYKPSALSSLQAAAPTGLPGLPSVGAYYSPYSLYGQRLAAGGVAP